MRAPSAYCLALSATAVLACASTRALPSQDLAAVQGDTSRPALPPLPTLPSDSTLTIESPEYPRSQLLYYRNIVGVVFDSAASGVTVRDLLARYHAIVIGGVDGASDQEYILQVPDPGPTLQALESLLQRLGREPGVRRASSLYYRTPGSIYSGQLSTTWPVLTNTLPNLDTSRVVRLPGDTFQLFRTDISLRFRAGVSDSAKRAFFVARSMIVLGVTESGCFFVRIPDPGPRAENLFATMQTMRSSPEIGIVTFIPRSSLPHVE